MFRQFKDYFHFNKLERQGIFILLFLITAVIVAKELLIYFGEPITENQQLVDRLTAEIDQIQADAQTANAQKGEYSFSAQPDSTIEENFDPNNLNGTDWQKLGLSEKQAATLLNYKEMIGGFESKAEFKKVFVISDELYAELEPFIALPASSPKQKNSYKTEWKDFEKFEKPKKVYPKVLLNTADTAELKKLYGIGDYYAQKIVDYRTELGGFISKAQLAEIWGLEAATLLKIDSQLVLNKIEIKKLSVNNSTADELKVHPYLYWKQANILVKYREQHGKYKKLEDIKGSVLITDSIYKKVSPYLKL